MTHPVTGSGLLSLVSDFAGAPKSQLVTAAGYIRPDGKLAYTAFYEALLAARGIRPVPAGVQRRCGDGPAIYVACLASYNAGRLVGSWLDLSDGPDADDIREAIAGVIADSPAPDAEEYAIHDSQGLPDLLARTEWPDIDDLASYCQTWAELSDDDAAAYRICCNDAGVILSESQFRDAFCGWYDSPAEFAQDRYDEQGRIPDDLVSYIDWDAVWGGEFDCNGYGATFDTSRGQYLITCPA